MLEPVLRQVIQDAPGTVPLGLGGARFIGHDPFEVPAEIDKAQVCAGTCLVVVVVQVDAMPEVVGDREKERADRHVGEMGTRDGGGFGNSAGHSFLVVCSCW